MVEDLPNMSLALAARLSDWDSYRSPSFQTQARTLLLYAGVITSVDITSVSTEQCKPDSSPIIQYTSDPNPEACVVDTTYVKTISARPQQRPHLSLAVYGRSWAHILATTQSHSRQVRLLTTSRPHLTTNRSKGCSTTRFTIEIHPLPDQSDTVQSQSGGSHV